jgi:ElaB/YqjD/DUF883 family membrane-anchored ribosome-binding protein
MARAKVTRKKSLKAGSPGSVGGRARKKSPVVNSDNVNSIISNISDVTGRQLKRLRKGLGSATEKETNVLKDISEKVHQFANKETELTRLKIELPNLKEEHEGLLRVMGENLWNMHRANRMTRLKSKFKYDFKRLQEVEAEIKEKKRTAARITTFLKNIR